MPLEFSYQGGLVYCARFKILQQIAFSRYTWHMKISRTYHLTFIVDTFIQSSQCRHQIKSTGTVLLFKNSLKCRCNVQPMCTSKWSVGLSANYTIVNMNHLECFSFHIYIGDFWEELYNDEFLWFVVGPISAIIILTLFPSFIGIFLFIREKHVK